MSVQDKAFTPGKILHESIVGAMRCRGTNFNKWCQSKGVLESTAKAATHGQMSGPKGLELLDAMIEAAGPEQVALSYRHRILEEAERIRRVPDQDYMAAA